MPIGVWIVAAGLLASCGGEVAGTAAATAKLQASQVEQAKTQEAQVRQQLDAALQKAAEAASAAGGN